MMPTACGYFALLLSAFRDGGLLIPLPLYTLYQDNASPLRDGDKSAVRSIFNHLDHRSIGRLGLPELHTLRKALSANKFVSEQETSSLLRHMDIDRDGIVNRADFEEYMESWLRTLYTQERETLYELCLGYVASPSPPPAVHPPAAVAHFEAALEELEIPSTLMSELKNYKQPPSQAEHTLALVLYLLGRSNCDWRHSKHALQPHHRFLLELKDFTRACSVEGFGADPGRFGRFTPVAERLAFMGIDLDYVEKGKHDRKRGDTRNAVVRLLGWLVYLTTAHRIIMEGGKPSTGEGQVRPDPVVTIPLPAPTPEEMALSTDSRPLIPPSPVPETVPPFPVTPLSPSSLKGLLCSLLQLHQGKPQGIHQSS